MSSTAIEQRPSSAHQSLACRFLAADFAKTAYANWPIDRRLDAFLSRCGVASEFHSGDEMEASIEQVMRAIRPAQRSGVLR